MKVAKLMSKPVHTCRIGDRLEQPARSMWEADIGSVPVLDADSKVVGMITDRDICMAAYTQGQSLAAIPVERAMAPRVVTCKPDDDLVAAAHLLRRHRLHRLPVVDADGRLTGILALNDLARFTARQRSESHPDLTPDELVTTLAAICEPRWVRTADEPKPATPAAGARKLQPRTAKVGA